MTRESIERNLSFCSEIARSVEEPLIGTAPKDALNVLAIAYDDAWAKDPLPASSLSEIAKTALLDAVKAVPRTRIVFVRRPGVASTPTLLVARTAIDARVVLRFDLGSYDELASIDLASVLRDGTHPRAKRIEKQTVFVCGHGKRDRCCARLGTPIYELLRNEPRVETWVSSHLGGHRFAPILLSLPDGHSYGRMREDEVPAFVSALLEHRFHDVARVRGRSGLDEAVQAAELLFRLRQGLSMHDDVRAIESTKGTDGTVVRLATPDGEVSVTVRKRALEGTRPSSCGEEPTAAFAFELV